jgi:hypothetical protein
VSAYSGKGLACLERLSCQEASGMNVIEVGRHAIAVTSSGILALLLSDCAIRSSPAVPPSPSNAGTAATGNQIFKYTGKKQTFTVPRGVTMLTIAAYGASGGSIGSYAGGRGALVKAKIPVTPEESLSVFVGASGRIGSRRAFNGGGAGAGTRHHHSSGGGGASDVRLDTGVRILIAGGGGGAGAASGEHLHRDPALRSAFTGYGQGGDGGGKVADSGSEGAFGYYRAAGGDGGGGGSQTTGGSGGNGGSSSGSCSGRTGGSGARHVGGAGGSACYAGGGGGGGGLYGGGGGGGSGLTCGPTYYGEYGYCAWGGGGGGGGGSSFIEKSATTIQNLKGAAPPGDGRVEISW